MVFQRRSTIRCSLPCVLKKTHPLGGIGRNLLFFKVPNVDKMPFRARQMHPAIVVGVEPDGKQALRLVLVAVDIVALMSTGRGNNEMGATTITGTIHRHEAFCHGSTKV